jgi:DNA-binding response OmpR family regulator
MVMKIGLVEPDELLADLVSFRMELLGHQVVTWQSGGDMLEAIAENPVDCLVVDTYLPDMQGWEAIHRVRKSFALDVLPILALSIDTDLSLVEQAYRAGANDYLITPFDPVTLQAKCDAMLLRRTQIQHR